MDEVRIGIVGAGAMGQMAHLKNYATLEGCRIVALAELRPELGRAAAAHHGIPRVYADHRAMLEAEALDGVVATLPFQAHAAAVPDIYARVKHVFTEKPLAVSVEAGERLARAAAEAGVTHMVGYHKRSDPAVLHARRTIEAWRASGQMGALRYVRILMPPGEWIAGGLDGRIETGEPLPPLPLEPPPAGIDPGLTEEYVVFVNYYIHQINLMRYLLGEPYRVAYADRSGVLMAVESESGAAGVIEMAPYRTTRTWEESALIGFERGTIAVRLPPPLAVNRPGRVEIHADPGGGVEPQRIRPDLPSIHAMRQQAIHFLRVCRGEMAPPCDAEEAVEDLRVARDYIRMRADR